MIYICCASISNKLSPSKAADAVTSVFFGESNSAYFNKIKGRIDESALESFTAYALLGRMIKEHFPCENQSDKPLILARGENGKPYFVNSYLKFSISHSKGVVACALSDHGEVGVDIEAATFPPEKAQKLAARYFDEDEQKKVVEDYKTFSRIWTQKEAASKLLGANLADYIKKSQESGDFTEISFHEFRYRSYPITLCTKRNCGKIILLDDNIE